MNLRHRPAPPDREAVREIVRSTGYFNAAEEAVAVELVDDWLARGDASGYRFIFAERPPGSGHDAAPGIRAQVVAYACYGPIAGTRGSYELYWIAVRDECRAAGIGSALLQAVVEAVRGAGGTRLYADTSSRAQYAPTRRFYETNGFERAALIQDFYAPGDGKVIYFRPITPFQ